jgi:hypothetical protein
VDEVRGPTNDAGTARIIVYPDVINVRADGYVAGTRRIEVSTQANEGTSRWDKGSSRGNDIHTSGDVVGAGANDVAVKRSADGYADARARVDGGWVRRAVRRNPPNARNRNLPHLPYARSAEGRVTR